MRGSSFGVGKGIKEEGNPNLLLCSLFITFGENFCTSLFPSFLALKGRTLSSLLYLLLLQLTSLARWWSAVPKRKPMLFPSPIDKVLTVNLLSLNSLRRFHAGRQPERRDHTSARPVPMSALSRAERLPAKCKSELSAGLVAVGGGQQKKEPEMRSRLKFASHQRKLKKLYEERASVEALVAEIEKDEEEKEAKPLVRESQALPPPLDIDIATRVDSPPKLKRATMQTADSKANFSLPTRTTRHLRWRRRRLSRRISGNGQAQTRKERGKKLSPRLKTRLRKTVSFVSPKSSSSSPSHG